MRFTSFRAVALLAAIAAAAAPTAAADIVVPGWKNIRHRVVLSAGAFDDRCRHLHVVEEGDTLSAIALRRLGDAKRAGEIAAANPGVVPEQLQLKAKLEIPAKVAGGGFTFWHLFGDDLSSLRPAHPGDRWNYNGMVAQVVAVADGHEEEFAKLRAGSERRPTPAASLLARPWAVATGELHLTRSVRDSSELDSACTTLALVAVSPVPEGGKAWRFDVKTEQFDSSGRPLSSGALEAGDGGAGDGGAARTIVSITLALLGAMTLAMRRRPRASSAPAT